MQNAAAGTCTADDYHVHWRARMHTVHTVAQSGEIPIYMHLHCKFSGWVWKQPPFSALTLFWNKSQIQYSSVCCIINSHAINPANSEEGTSSVQCTVVTVFHLHQSQGCSRLFICYATVSQIFFTLMQQIITLTKSVIMRQWVYCLLLWWLYKVGSLNVMCRFKGICVHYIPLSNLFVFLIQGSEWAGVVGTSSRQSRLQSPALNLLTSQIGNQSLSCLFAPPMHIGTQSHFFLICTIFNYNKNISSKINL